MPEIRALWEASALFKRIHAVRSPKKKNLPYRNNGSDQGEGCQCSNPYMAIIINWNNLAKQPGIMVIRLS
jgi:hypothetical protein